MGYAHSWKRPFEIEPWRFRAIVSDFGELLPTLERRGIVLAGGLGEGPPRLDEYEICFNGPAQPLDGRRETAHETFSFPRRVVRRVEHGGVSGHTWDSCKTNGKPYDLAVMVALVVANEHLGSEIDIESSGSHENWSRARRLCKSVLGYPIMPPPNAVTEPQLAAGPSASPSPAYPVDSRTFGECA